MTNINPPANVAGCVSYTPELNYGSAKWTNWAPGYATILTELSLQCLRGPLQHLPLNRTNRQGISGYCPLWTDAYDCIAGGLEAADLADFQSAGILLGITPSLLALTAPSIGELSLLFAQQPVLGALVCLGLPSLSIPRLLVYDDPMRSLDTRTNFFSRWPLRRYLGPGRSCTAQAALVALEYVVVMGAAANTVEASWVLGQQSLLAWRLEAGWYPFLWTNLAFSVQFLCALAWQFSSTLTAVRRTEPPAEKRKGAWWRRGLHWFTPSVTRGRRGYGQHVEVEESGFIIAINVLTQLAGQIILIFGTFVLSSLSLIGTRDAFHFVMRIVCSAIACRAVVIFELYGLGLAETSEEKR